MKPFWKSRRASEHAGDLAKRILGVLAKSQDPRNVSQLAKAVGANGGMIIVPLRILYNQGWVKSTSGKWSQLTAATDRDSYSITPEGRRHF